MKCSEKKKTAVSDYLTGKSTIREIADKYDVSKSAVSKWLTEYVLENPEAQEEIENIKQEHIIEGCISGGKEGSRSMSVNKSSKIAETLFGGRKVTRGTIGGEPNTDNRKRNVCNEPSAEGKKIAETLFGGRKVTRGTI